MMLHTLQLAGAVLVADQSTTGSWTHKVVSDIEKANAVELLRYVTPYSTPIDALKDVTQYAPRLLQDKLRFYSFVDTWASGPPGKVLWENGDQTMCQAVQPVGQGQEENGFELHAELLYFDPRKPAKANASLVEGGRPLAAGRVTQVIATSIRPSPLGAPVLMGEPEVVQVSKAGGAASSFLELDGALGHVLTHESMRLKEGETAKVFACREPGDVVRALRAHGSADLGLGASFLELAEASPELGPDFGVDYAGPNQISARLDAGPQTHWRVGAKVYARKKGPSHEFANASWGYKAAPQQDEIGSVVSMDLSDAQQPRALIEVSKGCPCDEDNAAAFAVSVPLSAKDGPPVHQVGLAVQRGGKLLLTTAEELAKSDQHAQGKEAAEIMPAFIEMRAATIRKATGGLRSSTVGSAGENREALYRGEPEPAAVESAAADPEAASEPVCVLREPDGTLAATEVDFGEALKPNERIFAHFTGTGHGWEKTKDKCGEFCDAAYALNVAGTQVGKPLRVFRDDCDQNPNSGQSGTWRFPRNGWCPGAVANGRYAEVTHLVQQGGKLPVAVELASVNGGKGSEFSNMQGFLLDDKAMFQTSLTFHRWEGADGEAPASLLEATEAGGMEMSETPEGDLVHGLAPAFFASDGSTGRGDNGPWHTYDPGMIAKDPPAHRVSIFSGSIHAMQSRLLTTAPVAGPGIIDQSVPWRIALRLRLESPPAPFKVDEWDRVASIGLLG